MNPRPPQVLMTDGAAPDSGTDPSTCCTASLRTSSPFRTGRKFSTGALWPGDLPYDWVRFTIRNNAMPATTSSPPAASQGKGSHSCVQLWPTPVSVQTFPGPATVEVGNIEQGQAQPRDKAWELDEGTPVDSDYHRRSQHHGRDENANRQDRKQAEGPATADQGPKQEAEPMMGWAQGHVLHHSKRTLALCLGRL